MSEKDEFIRKICEDPADDTARLVFADYLDEAGDGARAEFIRKGIALALLPPPPFAIQPTYFEPSYEGYVASGWPKRNLLYRDQFTATVSSRPTSATLHVPADRLPRNPLDVVSTYCDLRIEPVQGRWGPSGTSFLMFGFLVREITPAERDDNHSPVLYRISGVFSGEDPYPRRAEYDALKLRTDALLGEHECDWLGDEWGMLQRPRYAAEKDGVYYCPMWGPKWARGFPYAFAIPQATLTGADKDEKVGKCPRLDRFPITEVRLTDARPAFADPTSGVDSIFLGKWFWRNWHFKGSIHWFPSDVDHRVFEHLAAKRGRTKPDAHLAFYDSEDGALSDLSNACVKFKKALDFSGK